MSRTKSESPGGLSISAVERESGLPKDTLRVWERRYGFPTPARDPAGERIYSPDQVETLRLLRQLVDAGHRPGAIVGQSRDELLRRLEREPAPGSDDPEVLDLVDVLRREGPEGLHPRLTTLLHRHGLETFARSLAPRMVQAIGRGWADGSLGIHQEHVFTQQLTAVLREAIDRLAGAGRAGRPRVLLTTFPDEPHGLGLLMVEAVLVLGGARAIPLGVQTPVHAIAAAALDYCADVVALSLSAWSHARASRESLADLRRRLPASMELWAGGSCAGLTDGNGVRVLRSLDAIDGELRRWRGALPNETPS